MQTGELYNVIVEKLSNLGTGIVRVDGFVVFIDGACPDDKLKIKISKVNKTFANAEIAEIIEPSKYRITPFCPVQRVCGACQLQFIDYNYQLELKRQIVQDALHSVGGIDFDVPLTVPSPDNIKYRHKVQYPVSQTKVSKRLLAGYYKPQSHEIVNIKYCPIQPEICDKIIEFIRENAQKFSVSGYNEKTHTGDLRHVVLRISTDNGRVLVTLVVNSKKSFKKFEDFASEIYKNFDEIAGVCLNFNPKQTNVILSENTVCVTGQNFVEEKVLDKVFKIGADTFFQVNPRSAENIFAYVKDEIKKTDNPTVLDAYAGIATFGILVSDVSKGVVSVEFNKNSIEKAKEVLELNNINNVELHAEDTAKYLKKVKRKFDITILDPPRKGCTKESLDETLKHTKEKIIYVSCNPATLARDLKYLTEKGCKLESVQPFDMFCHTYHVETVAVIEI
ncbi:MAG: 23S rRNA (uracil(1939)-C(5))-methyltransferase RlmD [Candidatus Gastranaerophilaceae bacterium]|nr:23S rRNA (uracil(1939)-C(5))-methyltransferase RlmD [Candidatus Gastranaerophilaceae bacterium]